MNIVFISNYFNHHQKPLSDALASRNGYMFLATVPITEERLKLGWGSEAEPEYVCHYDREPERAEAALAQADVVIAGSAPTQLVRQCIRRGQILFRYAERPLKNGSEWMKFLPRLLKWRLQNPPGKKIYMLCSSAYTALDYSHFGLFRNRTLRWGYFPETICYKENDQRIRNKEPRSILWVGRFLDWKHPNDAIQVAAKLKAAGERFRLDMIGGGPMEEILKEMILLEGLEDSVHLLGTMKPDEVRRHMEEAQVFLFTSDRREGWGAVLNEAMNSGCAVVASDAIGAVPFLIEDGKNGCVYHSGNVEELFSKVSALLAAPERTRVLGAAAYATIIKSWNAEVAAERFCCLAERVLKRESIMDVYSDGPCSPAEIIREDWYK